MSGKTRKMVPSATPAASAICRVVTFLPYRPISGRVAVIRAARRSSGGNGRARPGLGAQWSGVPGELVAGTPERITE
ncbi:hypothetical protein GCM10027605_38230 [Micromonospora zhanjiangensis]